MIDYIEGVLRMEKLLKRLHDELLNKKYQEARETCQQMSTEARLVYHQIQIQSDK